MIRVPRRARGSISWLPTAHIAERDAHHYLPIVYGCTVTLLPEPARGHRATCPRCARPGSSRCRGSGRSSRPGSRRCSPASPTSSAQARAGALDAALEKVRLEQAGEQVPDELAAARRDRPTRRCSPRCAASSASTQVAAVNVGAAPTPLEVLEFFHAIGIPICELWGMSRDLRRRHRQPAGARSSSAPSGRPSPGVEIELAERRRGAGPRRRS